MAFHIKFRPSAVSRLTLLLIAYQLLLNSGSTDIACVRSVRAFPNILRRIADALVGGEDGMYYKTIGPVKACRRMHPPNNLVRTYLWRISPRRDMVRTERPSFIFGIPGELRRFNRNDPNLPFTSKYARKAFENADVYVKVFDGYLAENFNERMVACARLPRNQTVHDILSADVVAKLSELWNELFLKRQPPILSSWFPSVFGGSCYFPLFDAVKEWRDKSPFLIREVIDTRLSCLLGMPALAAYKGAISTTPTSESFVMVNFERYLVEKARRAGKILTHTETLDDVCRSWFHLGGKEFGEALVTKALPFWQNNSVYEPYVQFESQSERRMTDLHACGKLNKSITDAQCSTLVRFFGSGAPLSSVEKTLNSYCVRSPNNRAERIADRLDTLIRLHTDKSIFYTMDLRQLPMDDDSDEFETSSVMGRLRLRGYRVDELYLPQNSTNDEKFPYK